jgi:hypothetical protein
VAPPPTTLIGPSGSAVIWLDVLARGKAGLPGVPEHRIVSSTRPLPGEQSIRFTSLVGRVVAEPPPALLRGDEQLVAFASAAAFEPAPLVTLVRSFAVAKLDSIGFASSMKAPDARPVTHGETALMRLRGGRVGRNVVVRCKRGHLYTTIWIPEALDVAAARLVANDRRRPAPIS